MRGLPAATGEDRIRGLGTCCTFFVSRRPKGCKRPSYASHGAVRSLVGDCAGVVELEPK